MTLIYMFCIMQREGSGKVIEVLREETYVMFCNLSDASGTVIKTFKLRTNTELRSVVYIVQFTVDKF